MLCASEVINGSSYKLTLVHASNENFDGKRIKIDGAYIEEHVCKGSYTSNTMLSSRFKNNRRFCWLVEIEFLFNVVERTCDNVNWSDFNTTEFSQCTTVYEIFYVRLMCSQSHEGILKLLFILFTAKSLPFVIKKILIKLPIYIFCSLSEVSIIYQFIAIKLSRWEGQKNWPQNFLDPLFQV